MLAVISPLHNRRKQCKQADADGKPGITEIDEERIHHGRHGVDGRIFSDLIVDSVHTGDDMIRRAVVDAEKNTRRHPEKADHEIEHRAAPHHDLSDRMHLQELRQIAERSHKVHIQIGKRAVSGKAAE